MDALQATRITLIPRLLFASVDLVHLPSVRTSIFGLDLVSHAPVMVSWQDMSSTGRRTSMMLVDPDKCHWPKL